MKTIFKVAASTAAIVYGLYGTGITPASAEEAAEDEICSPYDTIKFTGRVELGQPSNDTLDLVSELHNYQLQDDVTVAHMTYKPCGMDEEITEPFDRVQIDLLIDDHELPKIAREQAQAAFNEMLNMTCPVAEVHWIHGSTGGTVDGYEKILCRAFILSEEPAGNVAVVEGKPPSNDDLSLTGN